MKNIPKYIVVGALVLACVIYLFSRCTLFLPDESPATDDKTSGLSSPFGEIDEEIQNVLDSMSLEEKIYQMFYVTPEQLTGVSEVIQAGETTKSAIEEKPVGGIIYFAQNLQNPDQTKEMLEKTQSFAKVPMFLGTMEEGGVALAISDNPAMSLGKIEPMAEVEDSDRAYEIGKRIGEELSELGFNMNFAPVADVMGEGKVNAIGNRSFGTDESDVSEKVSEVIKGFKESGISATLKHFPGQGYTDGDTSLSYPETSRSAAQIRSVELMPFKKGIESGADFVMLGHIMATELDAENPATFSKKIINEILREELGFKGIVITNAMNEGAVLNSHTSGAAAIEAVKAGADMILIPNSFEAAFEALYEAVKSGEISESRIDESVIRILRCKSEKGLI